MIVINVVNYNVPLRRLLIAIDGQWILDPERLIRQAVGMGAAEVGTVG